MVAGRRKYQHGLGREPDAVLRLVFLEPPSVGITVGSARQSLGLAHPRWLQDAPQGTQLRHHRPLSP